MTPQIPLGPSGWEPWVIFYFRLLILSSRPPLLWASLFLYYPFSQSIYFLYISPPALPPPPLPLNNKVVEVMFLWESAAFLTRRISSNWERRRRGEEDRRRKRRRRTRRRRGEERRSLTWWRREDFTVGGEKCRGCSSLPHSSSARTSNLSAITVCRTHTDTHTCTQCAYSTLLTNFSHDRGDDADRKLLAEADLRRRHFKGTVRPEVCIWTAGLHTFACLNSPIV